MLPIPHGPEIHLLGKPSPFHGSLPFKGLRLCTSCKHRAIEDSCRQFVHDNVKILVTLVIILLMDPESRHASYM